MKNYIDNYIEKLSQTLNLGVMYQIQALGEALLKAWIDGRTIYFCGNGGSAGNAIHLANDFIYGAGLKNGGGLRTEALSANTAILTCLANDIGYDNIYSEQIKIKGNSGDILVILSGSGNSPNVVNAIKTGNAIGMKTFAILGFSGGLCKEIVQYPIHFEVDDMQIAEDIQLVVGHICMQWLRDQDLSTDRSLSK
jgi:D-sedoheptulose 7-phosphate isomerase